MQSNKPITAVWELTMGCNMRCKHCGSSCSNPQLDELTTKEALDLCDDLGKLGFEYITLSGGEPTTRRDWDLIANKLNQNGIKVHMITNGWLINENIINKAINAKIDMIAISIDGLEETHDFMRKPGSFQKDMDVLEMLHKAGIRTAVVTTINKKNIKELTELKEILIEKKVVHWQLQFGLPMGTLAKNLDLVIDPENIDEIIEFEFKSLNDNRITIFTGDCVGYFNKKDIKVKTALFNKEYLWTGCGAGKKSLGILCNGDIVGCTSLRSKDFIEGNIRKTSIIDIWNNDNSFKWNRKIKQHNLSGFCSECIYGKLCLGGCSNTRLCMEHDIYGENKYCSYHNYINKIKNSLKDISDTKVISEKALALLKNNQYQLATILFKKVINLDNSITFNIETKNMHVLTTIGLTYIKVNKVEEGLKYLNKSIEFSDNTDMEAYYYLATVLIKLNKTDDAINVLKKAHEVSDLFYLDNINLYEDLKIYS